METKSYPQSGGVHDCFNTLHRLASPVIFSSTVIVSHSRIHANIGHGFSIHFDVDLIDAIPQIFVVFRGDIVIFPKAFSKSAFQLDSLTVIVRKLEQIPVPGSRKRASAIGR